MVSSDTSFDSVAMFPTGCFYSPQMQTSKWTNEDPTSRHINGLETKYDPTARFSQMDSTKYSFQSSPKCSLDLKCSQDVRWSSHAEFPYQLQFPPTVTETYPTDPFPSTSVAFKMENSYSYPSTVIPQVYTPQSTDYFTASQQFSSFKMPTMNSINSAKMASSNAVSSTSNLPYRTGPGTNNVRVRTSEKYRMVYTDHQRLELEKEFLLSHFINAERKAQLSSSLQLTERQIKIWFQNSRQ
ncbi:unnamed protein product [Enterobius vermicularis]|uniref:Homeobox domain-containing protein n=1 Tax=Enterobius vermicularis TaxID=51028 RepID=A0A0N4V6B5_ENTVE|nr:unnamed protein product [Enterobius vermicularis]